MIRIRFTSEYGTRVAGEVRDYDEHSAHALIEEGVADLADSQPAELYDPAEYNVDEVLAHLAVSDEAEVERVRTVEAAGRDRVGIRAPEAP